MAFRKNPILEDVSWMNRAACRESDPKLFFPARDTEDNEPAVKTAYDLARDICADCSVINECLVYAMTINAESGMWGGKSPAERRKMIRTQRRYLKEKAYLKMLEEAI